MRYIEELRGEGKRRGKAKNGRFRFTASLFYSLAINMTDKVRTDHQNPVE